MQFPKYGLGPEAVLVLVDELQNRRRVGSSSWAKKAEAALRISQDRRSSVFSLRSLASSSFSEVVSRSSRSKILTARRLDLSADRTRAINRLRSQMLEYFPALERAFDYGTSKTALVLLTGYRTPAALRRIGRARLASWLTNHGLRAGNIAKSAAEAAVTAAETQHTVVPGEKTAAKMVHTVAREVMVLDEEISELNALIEGRFREHPDAELITSMPGIGDTLGAEFIAATGGDMTAFGSPDRLAGVAGLAPVSRDSGKVSGNLRGPRRYSRRLLRMFYLSAQVAATRCPVSKAFYQRKRNEGKSHKQAVLALARRRLNVLWALIRDRRPFETITPAPAGPAA
ncbi:transposase [Streptomyces goshikiensis]|uniref:transposase n=1 Tax=Streptomyces goshikiensis TaxID=1942 RepID=UPI003674C0B1